MAAKIFCFVFSGKFREIVNFVFRKIFLQFHKIFAKHKIEICAKFSRNSKEILQNLKEISRNAKQKSTFTSFFKNALLKSNEKCNFSENPKIKSTYCTFRILNSFFNCIDNFYSRSVSC